MKKIGLSGFDLGFIIAAVVVALLGIGAWWYLSGALQTAQDDVNAAKQKYNGLLKDTKFDVAVNAFNLKGLQANIDLLKGQLDPLIPDKLQAKDNKLASLQKEDPVAWKHDLDDKVHSLTQSAKAHVVTLPENFYFGFSRYLSQSPGDEQTQVLSKQLIGVDTLATILINAPVRGIAKIRRTYEEDQRPPTFQNNPYQGFTLLSSSQGDQLPGYSINGGGGLYTAYPFEITFDTTAENLRTVLDNILKSPYVFIVRSIVVKDSKPQSPHPSDLDAIAGTSGGGSSVVGSAPGEVAATTSTAAPQMLFGDSHLTVIARIDLIEWKGPQQ